MFCPHCGTEATSELNYCKRCGGNLSLPVQAQEFSRPAISAGVAWAIGGTTFFIVVIGLVSMLAALTDMARGREFLGAIVAIAAAGGITIIASVFMLMRLWSRVLGDGASIGGTRKESRRAASSKKASAPELNPARISALPISPISSVTEHTTRTFAPVYKDRD